MRSSVKIEHRCGIERVAILANDGLGIRGIEVRLHGREQLGQGRDRPAAARVKWREEAALTHARCWRHTKRYARCKFFAF
jgi:hypothetical protein